MSQDWGYGPDNGPAHWGAVAPDSLGRHQSPINIHAAEAEYSREMAERPLEVRYNPLSCQSIVNNGRSVQVSVESNITNLSGGPLENCEYALKQFHFHWGSNSHHGSEHHIDGTVYAAELHLVHWNKTQFKSFNDALLAKDGLTVLAVFLKAGDSAHLGLKPLTDLLARVRYAHDEVHLDAGLDVSALLPGDLTRYWTYSGSLTTPPCHECVRFVIFKEPINVSEDQMHAFRSLEMTSREGHAHAGGGDSCCHLVNNFRPTMPLNGRTVHASFRKFFA
jgi:carbonic anhydrase